MVHVDVDAFGLDKGGVMGVATVTSFAVVMGYAGRAHTSCISHFSRPAPDMDASGGPNRVRRWVGSKLTAGN